MIKRLLGTVPLQWIQVSCYICYYFFLYPPDDYEKKNTELVS